MNADDKNDCAFPCPEGHSECYHPRGLTKREYFAAKAMQGLLGNSNFTADSLAAATDAVNCADALFAELAKTKEGK